MVKPDEATTAINAGGANTVQIVATGAGVPFVSDVLTNTSQQVKALASAVGSTYTVATTGWQDQRKAN